YAKIPVSSSCRVTGPTSRGSICMNVGARHAHLPGFERKIFYYGWANLGIAALAMVGTLPGRTQGLGLVTEPLLADLQIDRVTYATLNLWATLIGALFCLPCGKLVDRWGSRGVLAGVSLALGATVLTMSSASSLAML